MPLRALPSQRGRGTAIVTAEVLLISTCGDRFFDTRRQQIRKGAFPGNPDPAVAAMADKETPAGTGRR